MKIFISLLHVTLLTIILNYFCSTYAEERTYKENSTDKLIINLTTARYLKKENSNIPNPHTQNFSVKIDKKGINTLPFHRKNWDSFWAHVQDDLDEIYEDHQENLKKRKPWFNGWKW